MNPTTAEISIQLLSWINERLREEALRRDERLHGRALNIYWQRQIVHALTMAFAVVSCLPWSQLC